MLQYASLEEVYGPEALTLSGGSIMPEEPTFQQPKKVSFWSNIVSFFKKEQEEPLVLQPESSGPTEFDWPFKVPYKQRPGCIIVSSKKKTPNWPSVSRPGSIIVNSKELPEKVVVGSKGTFSESEPKKISFWSKILKRKPKRPKVVFKGSFIKRFLLRFKRSKASTEECSICTENTGTVIRSACDHFFHKQCINKWLKENDNCPNCRRSFVLNDPEYKLK
jgi:Ring finger domain